MIDATDFTIPGTNVFKNKRGITDPTALLKAAADSTALRLAELHASPIVGGFDSSHLQAIHRHLYQDIYDWAGELRRADVGDLPASEIAASLDAILDRLRRENHLKGFLPDEWALSASTYIYDLGAIQPFLAGNDVALREFAEELARKNNLSLQWGETPDLGMTEVTGHFYLSEQSANIRRMVMLAMDSTPNLSRPSRGNAVEREIKSLLLAGNSLL